MAELFAPTIADQIACVERELEMRRRAYPRFVAKRQMTQAKADREIVVMTAVLVTLKNLEIPRPPGERAAQQRQE